MLFCLFDYLLLFYFVQVAPVSTSEAQLLAPQEIMGEERARARGELTGAEERTETDRKRERRKKKAKQGAIARWVSRAGGKQARWGLHEPIT